MSRFVGLALAVLSSTAVPLPSWADVRAQSALETNLCTEQLLMGDPKTGPSWNG
jgi:hypothetical protein